MFGIFKKSKKLNINRLPQSFLVNMMKHVNDPKTLAALSQLTKRTRNTVMKHPNYEKKKLNFAKRKNRQNIGRLIYNRNNGDYAVYENTANKKHMYEYRLFKNLNPQRLIRINKNGTVKVYPQHVRQHSHYLIVV